MTYFPNFGLINGMTKHLVNNNSPKILDYSVDGRNGYTYAPVSSDLVNGVLPTSNAFTQQQRLNAVLDDIIYANSRHNNLDLTSTQSKDMVPINQINGQTNSINSLMQQSPSQVITPNNIPTINTTADVTHINDDDSQSNVPSISKEGFDHKSSTLSSESIDRKNKINFITIIIIVFAAFMIVQLYLSQKKMDLILDMTTRHTLSQLHPHIIY